jgi:hypothetical protein
VTTHYWLQNEHLRNADRAEHYLDRVLEIAPDAVEAKTNSRVLRVTPTALRAGRIPKVPEATRTESACSPIRCSLPSRTPPKFGISRSPESADSQLGFRRIFLHSGAEVSPAARWFRLPCAHRFLYATLVHCSR